MSEKRCNVCGGYRLVKNGYTASGEQRYFCKDCQKDVQLKTAHVDFLDDTIISNGNTLVIGDMHAPFIHPDYLEFLKRVRDSFNCETVVHAGDIVDHHAISFHESDPDGFSAGDEYNRAIDTLIPYYIEFPNAYLCLGNHDALIARKARTAGLNSIAVRTLHDVYQMPKGWRVNTQWQIDGVLYQHGTGRSGKYPHAVAAEQNRQSTVIGHVHSVGGVHYIASQKDIIFGMCVGCGVDVHTYAMEYAQNFTRKPVLGCGVVMDGGHEAAFIPMYL
jgi:predicted phosphodiesterase